MYFLGISVKGKTSSNSSSDKCVSQDLGIFIKNVIHGGAASRWFLKYQYLFIIPK